MQDDIAVLSDQTLFRQGVAGLLKARGFARVVEFTTSADLLAAAKRRCPSVVMVDLDHERVDTNTLVRTLRAELPHSSIVLIGTALRQGAVPQARGAVETPRADALALASAAALTPLGRQQSAEASEQRRRWSRLTSRQRAVLEWLAIGLENREIGKRLHIGERAVKAHMSSLLQHFAVANRTQLALLAREAGLRPPTSAKFA